MALIEVKNLKKTYLTDGVKTPAIRGISFSIEKGEFVAIMGPSGCGKSTLMHILGLLDLPSQGQYLFEEKSINDYSEKELARLRNKKMGFVFQSFNLLPRATVLENIKLPLLYSKIKEKRWTDISREAIEAVGLSHRTDYLTSKLSGGEKQRVAIARALIQRPQVIFADEPTGNLDSKSGSQIMDILEKLNDQGRTVILVTHETYTAQYAQRVILLKDGLLEKDSQVDHRRKGAKNSFRK